MSGVLDTVFTHPASITLAGKSVGVHSFSFPTHDKENDIIILFIQ